MSKSVDPNEQTFLARVEILNQRIHEAKKHDLYPYMHSSDAVEGVHVTVHGRPMLQFASYSYLDLLGHPKINAAAKKCNLPVIFHGNFNRKLNPRNITRLGGKY